MRAHPYRADLPPYQGSDTTALFVASVADPGQEFPGFLPGQFQSLAIADQVGEAERRNA